MFSTRLRTRLVASALAWLALGSALLLAQAKKPAGKTVKNEVQTFNLAAGSRVIIENEAGDISVESWDKSACEINIFKASTLTENFEKIKVDVEESPNRLRIKTRYPARLPGENSVDFILSVPASVDLQIRNGAGRIQVRDVTGRLSVQTERGDLQLKNVSGAVDGKTEAGNIVLDLQQLVTRDISLKTDEGSIQLNIARDLNAFIWAESEDGKVRNGLKFQELFAQEPALIKGQLGQGGKLVRLQAGRGEISLAPGREKSGVAAAAESTSPVAPSSSPPDISTKNSPMADAAGTDDRTGRPSAAPRNPASSTPPLDDVAPTKAGSNPTANARATRSGQVTPDSDAAEDLANGSTHNKSLKVESLDRDSAAPAKKLAPPPNFRANAEPVAPPPAHTPRASSNITFKVDTNLITLNASVRDRFTGKSLLGLKQNEFEIFEDNVQQELAYFRPVETPFHLLLLLDISGSIEEKFDIVQEASIRFTQLLKPQDRIAIATFNHEFSLVKDFTNDRKELARAILEIVPGGGTAFYDAMEYSITSVFKGVKGRRAIVVFTDGVDNQHMMDLRQYGSSITFPELFRMIEESDINIYSIFLNTEGDPRSGVVIGSNGSVWDTFDTTSIVGDVLGIKKRRSSSSSKRKTTVAGPVHSDMYANAIDELNKMADQTGGKMFAPTDARDLNGVYEQIVEDLSTQYSLGYYPSNPKSDGAWRKISVKVKERPETLVKARRGYYARFGSDVQKSRRTLDLGRTRDPGDANNSTSRPKRRVF